MSGKIKILGLVCVAVLAVLFAGVSLGTLPDDPCGGHFVGEGLRALFSESYNEGGVTYNSSIFNDVPGYFYKYQVPGGDCVFYFRAGQIEVGVDKSRNGRYVNIRFDGTKENPEPLYCGKPYFIDGTGIDFNRAATFIFRTAGGFTGSRDDNGQLVLTGTGGRLDLGAMSPGQTSFCSIWVTFSVADDPSTAYNESLDFYDFEQTPVKVYYGLVDGTLKWVIRPIAEPYWIYTEIKKGNKVIGVDKSYYSLGTLYRFILSNARSLCKHGTFYFPFELILERL